MPTITTKTRSPGRPRIADRTTERVQVSILSDDLAGIDAFAAEIAEPGMAPNRSAAVRRIYREWRAARHDSGTIRPPNGVD